MNVYLDIDGVILGTYSPKRNCVRFLKYLLKNYSDSTYWLTTHCSRGENHTRESLQGVYPDKLVDKVCSSFKPTDWGSLDKTCGIDFSKPFIWFDDNAFEYEKHVLKLHGVLGSYHEVNPKDPKGIKRALRKLRKVKRSTYDAE